MTSNGRGIALMLAAMAGFAVGDASIKALGPVMEPGTLITLLGAGGVPIFLALAKAQGERVPWRLTLHPVVFARNVAEVVGVLAMVSSLIFLPLSLVTAVTQVAPILALGGAALFLGETVGVRRWSAVAAGLVGVIVMISPWDNELGAMVALPIVASIGLAARDVLTRRIPKGIPNPALALWGTLSVTAGGVVYALVSGEALDLPSGGGLVLLAVATVFGAVSYYAVTAALRAAPVSVVTPFRYSRLLFAAGLGILLFGERPGPEVWLGAAIVVAAGLYAIARGEAKRAVPQAAAPR